MFLNIFANKLAKILPFFVQTTASFCRNLTIILILRKTLFLAKNWQKLATIVIITSTPDDGRKFNENWFSYI
jgi:hypothetical protein